MKFSVRKTGGGTLFEGNLDGDTRIIDVKNIIAGKWKFPPDQQRLIFNGKELDDVHTLADYNVGDGAIINFVSRLEGGRG